MYKSYVDENNRYGVISDSGNVKIPDVACNAEEIKIIVKKLNDGEVAEVHAQDVIEDLIS